MSWFYTDRALLALEKERIFRRTWQLVGTLNQPCGEFQGVKRTIADVETFFTCDVAGGAVVDTRDKSGTRRAFSNVCRHRAGPVAQGSGCKNALNCVYRGWSDTLDGRRIGTPEIDGVEFFDRSTIGLVPLPYDFVNLDPEEPSLTEFLGEIPQQASEFRFEGLRLPSAAITSRITIRQNAANHRGSG